MFRTIAFSIKAGSYDPFIAGSCAAHFLKGDLTPVVPMLVNQPGEKTCTPHRTHRPTQCG